MPELDERIEYALTALAPSVPTDGVLARLAARRRRRQLRRVVVPAASIVVALLVGAAVLTAPSDSTAPVTTEGGNRVTTDTAPGSDQPTGGSLMSGDAPSSGNSERTQGGRSADGRSGAPTAESLVPAGFHFFTPRGRTNELGIARFDFTDHRVLFTYPADASPGLPVWSPDRERIAVSYCTSASSCVLRTVTPDGKLSAPLGAGVVRWGRGPRDAADTWSPDGRWIEVQTSFDDPAASIVPSNGGPARKVGLDTSAVLAWSPDSKRIAYVEAGVLTVSNVDGGGARKFVDPMHRDTSRATNPVSVAVWSPDGRTLAVSRGYRPKQDDSADNPNETPTPATALIDLETGSWRELGDWEFHGDWTHDGAALIVRVPKVWNTTFAARGCPGDSPVLALDIRTGARRSFGTGCSMGLSPDGTHVFVAELRQVRVVPVAGDDPHGRVVTANARCCEWSPGSDAIVEADHRAVVRIDGRGRWEAPSS